MQPPSGSFRLIVRRGPQPNQVYELTKDVVTIGRDITNDITINDPEVSRHHTKLTREGQGYLIEDVGSTNGTFVNGQRLVGIARPLMPGEMVGLGETVTLAFEATFLGAPSPYSPSATVGPSVPSAVAQAPSPMRPMPQIPPQAPPPPPYQSGAGATQVPSGYSPYAPPPVGGMPLQAPPTYYPEAYGAPAQPAYAPYPEERRRGGGIMRWVLLGCGCFIILCVLGSVVGLIAVDQTCAWKEEPFTSLADVFGLAPDLNSPQCQ